MTARTAMAPKVPQKITLRWVFLGRLRATRPMIRALSPAKTRSMRTMASRAEKNPAENSSGSTMNLQRKRKAKAAVFSSEAYRHLTDGAPAGRAQDPDEAGGEDTQNEDSECPGGAGQQ